MIIIFKYIFWVIYTLVNALACFIYNLFVPLSPIFRTIYLIAKYILYLREYYIFIFFFIDAYNNISFYIIKYRTVTPRFFNIIFFSLNFFKLRYSKLVQPSNIFSMLPRFEVSKFDKFNELNERQF